MYGPVCINHQKPCLLCPVRKWADAVTCIPFIPTSSHCQQQTQNVKETKTIQCTVSIGTGTPTCSSNVLYRIWSIHVEICLIISHQRAKWRAHRHLHSTWNRHSCPPIRLYNLHLYLTWSPTGKHLCKNQLWSKVLNTALLHHQTPSIKMVSGQLTCHLIMITSHILVHMETIYLLWMKDFSCMLHMQQMQWTN